MKWDRVLNKLGLKTEVKFIKKCCNKNIIKNIADKAIKTFLPIDDLRNIFYFTLLIINLLSIKIKMECHPQKKVV